MECVNEGGYLDLWLMLKDGIIEWKPFRKAPPIYVGPDSCHDPAQKGKSIMKGVGRRLRITSSKDEYFEEAVEDAAKGFSLCLVTITRKRKILFATAFKTEIHLPTSNIIF